MNALNRLKRGWQRWEGLTPLVFFAFLISAIGTTEGILRIVNFDFLNPIRTLYRGEDWRGYHMFEDRSFTPDPYLFWKPDPSKSALFNSKGFRGKEFSDLKSKGEIRIFCFGNSNTLGDKLSSYPTELQKYLIKENKNKFEVINAGVYGYTSFQCLRRFKQTLKYSPDIVTFCFGWNDAVMVTGLPDRVYGKKSVRFLGLQRFMYKFKTYHLLRYMVSRLITSKHKTKFVPRVSLEDFRQILLEIIKLSRSHGIKIILITRPYQQLQYSEDEINDLKVKISEKYRISILDAKKIFGWRYNVWRYNEIIREISKQYRVPLLDAEDIFDEKPQYFKDECHFNIAGNRYMAQKLYELLKSKYPEYF